MHSSNVNYIVDKYNKKQLKLKLNTSINKTTHLSQTILVKLISDS